MPLELRPFCFSCCFHPELDIISSLVGTAPPVNMIQQVTKVVGVTRVLQSSQSLFGLAEFSRKKTETQSGIRSF